MNYSNTLENIAACNEESLGELAQCLELSRGKFSLIYARCNYEFLREKIVRLLRRQSSVEFQELMLDKSDTNLYKSIGNLCENGWPNALMVFGLESVADLDILLELANRVRDEFGRFPFPIVLWVTNPVLKKLIRGASDFHTYASSPIYFSLPDRELTGLLSNKVRAVCAGDDNFQIDLREIEAFQDDLQSRQSELDSESKAYLAFLVGWGYARKNQIDAAVEKYRECLTFWEDNTDVLCRGMVQLFIAQIYPERKNAKNYFCESFKNFENANRLDLKAKNMGKLAAVLQQLEDWQFLEEVVAKEALPLHLKYGGFVAEDCGFLAVAAVQQSKWRKAVARAELALEILDKEEGYISGPRYWSLYLSILALAKLQLNKVENALAKLTEANNYLEAAREENLSENDARLLVSILEKLQKALFEKKQYLAAFNCKLTVRKIKSQYGWSAFIGAGRLQPSLKVINAKEKKAEEKGKIARNILAASGRQPDLERLIERMKNNRSKLTVIYGKSGVGKSSLLQAGLLPLMELDNFEGRDYLPILLRRYQHWDRELIEKLNESPLNPPLEKGDFEKDCWQRFRENERFLIVLIFDQFEEFFFNNPDVGTREEFYRFLGKCLDIPYLKVVLSLREDDLYYVLEFDRKTKLNIDKNYQDILYYLGNFSREDAKEAIVSLTERSKMSLDSDLVEELVKDLARGADGVRPIALQVVGALLETEEITTLKQYRDLGEHPKDILVERFLEDVVKDCGEENQTAAELVLYLLTSDRNTRPLKTASQLKENLEGLEVEEEKLDLVLEILVGSGLVLLLPETPENFYQLVHDYLVPFVRKQRSESLVSQLKAKQAELNRVLKRQLQAAGYGIAALVVLSFAFGGLWFRAEAERRRAEISEIEVLNINSDALFSTNQELEALLTAVTAVKKLNRISAPEELREEMKDRLAEVFRNIRERSLLEEHTSRVNSLSFSNDSRTLASASADNTVKLWSLDNISAQPLSLEHGSNLWSVSFSPDGKFIASASNDNLLRLWRSDGSPVRELRGHTNQVTSVSFSDDGEILASGSIDKSVILWNRDGTFLKRLEGHDRSVISVSFSSQDKLASASCDHKIKLWSRDGSWLQDLEGHDGCVWSVSFSPDGQILASGSFDGTVRLWSSDGNLIKTLEGHSDRVMAVSFSPDGQTLASASLDGSVILWHRNGTELETLRIHPKGVRDVSFSPDGKLLASASVDGTIKLWKYEHSLINILVWEEDNSLPSFSSNGQILASASNNDNESKIKLWTLDGRLLTTIAEHPAGVNDLSFSPEGGTIASTGNDGNIKLWSIDGKLLKTLEGQAKGNRVVYSPDGAIIALGAENGTIELWNRNGVFLRTLEGHQEGVFSLRFSPDGKILISGSAGGTIKIWNLKGNLLKTLSEHKEPVKALSFSPDSQLFVSASNDDLVILWKRDGTLLKTLKEHTDDVLSVQFSPNGKTIASASRDRTIKIWSLDGTELQSIRDNDLKYWAKLNFSPDGETLSVASVNTLKVWRLDGEKLQTLANTLNDLDELVKASCDWLKDYLKTNPNVVETEEGKPCD